MKKDSDEYGTFWHLGDEIQAGADRMPRLRSLQTWVEEQKKRGQEEATILSGFGKEILRLTAPDVKFLKDCGVKVE